MSLAVAYLLLQITSASTMQQVAQVTRPEAAMLGIWILLSSTLMFVYAFRTHQARARLYEGLFIAGTLVVVGLLVYAVSRGTAQADMLARLALLALQAGILALLWAGRQMATETGDADDEHGGPVDRKGTVSQLLTADMWRAIFPHQDSTLCQTGSTQASDVLSHANFIKACQRFPQFGRSALEIAAFLANMTQETFGGWQSAPGGTLSWGGCFGAELGCYVNDQSTVCSQYNTPPCAGMDASAGYYGRGALQLSYCANYEKAGQFLGKDLLGNPNLLVHDGVTAFEASLWYWTHFDEASCCGVTGQTCHAAITQDRDFSKTVAIINGGIECNTPNEDTLARTEFLRRHQALARICTILGIAVPPCSTTCNSWAGDDACYG